MGGNDRAQARPLRDERGAGSLEYIGIIAVVVIVVVAIVMQATPIGNTIAAQLCKAVGTECGETGPDTAAPTPEPTRSCTTSSRTENYAIDGSVLIVDIGGGVQIQRAEKSNGDVEVTIIDTGKLGASIKAPGADVELSGGVIENIPISDGDGDGKIGGGVSADAGLEGSLAYGDTYTFTGDDAGEQADQLIDYTRWSRGGDVAGSVVGGPIGPGLGFLVDLGYKWLNGYEPPAPTEHLLEGGLEVNANAGAGVFLGGAEGEVHAREVLGGRRAADGSSTTIYLKGSIGASGSANFATAGASGSADGTLVGEVTLDADGELVGVAISGAATAEGSIGITDFFGNPLTDLSAEGGKGIAARAEITVTDANRDQVLAALGQVGMMGAADISGAADHVQTGADAIDYLMAESQRTGGITAELTDVGGDTLLSAALGGRLPGVGGASIGISASTDESTLDDAWYLGDDGWTKWRNCAG